MRVQRTNFWFPFRNHEAQPGDGEWRTQGRLTINYYLP